MKTTTIVSLALASLALFGCQSRQESGAGQPPSETSATGTSAEARTESGWDKATEGAAETAVGVKDAVKAEACPVVGNMVTKQYYTQDDAQYERMLQGERIFGTDNRECFANAANAAEKGYTHATR